MAGSIDRLEAFMVSEHKLDPSVFQKVKDLGAQSVSDFFGLYTESDYEEGVKELLPAALAANKSSSVVCGSRGLGHVKILCLVCGRGRP